MDQARFQSQIPIQSQTQVRHRMILRLDQQALFAITFQTTQRAPYRYQAEPSQLMILALLKPVVTTLTLHFGGAPNGLIVVNTFDENTGEYWFDFTVTPALARGTYALEYTVTDSIGRSVSATAYYTRP